MERTGGVGAAPAEHGAPAAVVEPEVAPPPAGAPGAGRRRPPTAAASRARRWAATTDARCVALLALVPVLVFVVPALFGHPAVSGDNILQNLPLRALSGRLIRQGHLPLWNVYIWSGSPLLGGLNAGALYPTTLFFAVLPPVAAWVLNLLVVYWAAGLGMFALLRAYRLRPVASLLGALTFAYGGASMGQLVHLPIVQGIAWMPLMVLAVLRLSWAVLGTGPAGPGVRRAPRAPRAGAPPADVAPVGGGADGVPEGDGAGTAAPGTARRASAWPWTVLLAATGGLVLLTGEPRGMAEAEMVSVMVFGWLVVRPYGGAVALRARLRFAFYVALAAVWAAALGAIQILPGLRFISASQRAVETFAFFGSGSLPPRWSSLLLVPDLFGGDGLFHQPVYFNSYNLPEVTGYVGLVPLVAALALLTVSFGRRRPARASDWGLWMVVAVLGLLMAFGEYTWLGGLFGHVPFFDRLRLQSRNIAITDLGLSVLLAFWADRALSGRAVPESAGWRRWVALAPVLAAGAAVLTMLVVPARLEVAMGVGAAGARLGALLRPWMLVQLAMVLAVLAVVLWWRRLSPRARRWLLSAVVVADLVLFSVSSGTGLSAGREVVQPSPATARAVLGTSGRFAIYDATALNLDDLTLIGQPDLNAFTELPSVQGYGSIVAGYYGSVTGSHTLDSLAPCALARGAFAPLRLGSVLTLARYLAPPARAPADLSVPAPAGPSSCPGAPAAGTPTERHWYLGQALTVRAVQVVRTGGRSPGPGAPVRVGVMGPSGSVRWPAASVRAQPGGWQVTFARPQVAAGLVARGPARSFSDATTVTTTGGQAYAFDGGMQDVLGISGWRFAGLWREYATFRHPVRPSPVWLAHPVPGARVSQVASTDWGTAVAEVVAPRPVTVVRSETYLRGWHAELQSADGRTARTVVVHRDGLVQAVDVPAGSWRVTFLYRPAGLNSGIIGTTTGVALLVAAGAAAVVRRRRSRRAAAVP